MNVRKILTAATIVAASIGVGGSALAAKPAPLSYTCAVAKVGALPAGCAHLPGSWNDWAGRPTPARWDPCFARRDTTTMLYLQPCGPMNPTVGQWCTLHFDHHFMGVDVCHNPGQK